jgi:peptidoglycan/xylan/chitin deacetylase (PgdA/CDA1 family)
VEKPFILWSIDTEDWKSRNATSVYKKVIGHVSDGDIILMHDLYGSTADAVKKIVPKLIKQGYQLVTVSELAQYRNVTLENGESYRSMK